MTRRVLAALAVALLLVLAGCTGGGGGTTTTSADTETPTAPTTAAPTTAPSTTTPSQSIPASAYPAGTGPDGVTNASALVAAHNDVRFRSDFVGRETSVRTQLSMNSSFKRAQQSTAFVDVDAGRANITLRTATNASGSTRTTRTAAFVNESLLVTRSTDGNETTNRTSSVSSFESTVTAGQQIEGILAGVSYQPVATTQEGDRTLVEFDVTGINTTGIPGNRSVDNVDGSLVVDDRGLVRSLSLQYRITTEEGTPLLSRTYSRSVTPTDLDVDRPAWVASAIRAADGS